MLSIAQKKGDIIPIFGIEGYIAILAIISITIHLVLQYIPDFQSYSLYPLYLTLALGGGVLVFDLIRKLVTFKFGSDLLAGMSIITAILLEEYLAGSLVVLMLSGGETLENYAIRTASRMLEVLAKRASTIAHRKKSDVIEDISVEKIVIGDTIPPIAGTITQEIIDVAAIMNSLRTIWKPAIMSDMPLVKPKKQ
jgi:cation transport ATPase